MADELAEESGARTGLIRFASLEGAGNGNAGGVNQEKLRASRQSLISSQLRYRETIMRNKKTKQRVTTVSSGQLKVYRGITFKRELDLFRETDGYVMSQAALDGYGKNVFNGMNFRRAWKKSLNDSQLAYNNAVTEWGGVHWYCLAHAQLGTELTQQFGPRAMIS